MVEPLLTWLTEPSSDVGAALQKVSKPSPEYSDVICYRPPLMKLKPPSNGTEVAAGDNLDK
jgi:hypothetical protein